MSARRAAPRRLAAAAGARRRRAVRCGLRLERRRRDRAQGRRRRGCSRSAGFTPTGTITRRAARRRCRSPSSCPSGKTLTSYKTGPGPHTGVHLIIVRDDLAYIIHDHPPIAPTACCASGSPSRPPGRTGCWSTSTRTSPAASPTSSCSAPSTWPAPTTPGRCRRSRPTRSSTATTSTCRATRRCTRSRPQFLHVNVTDPQGRPVQLRPLVRRAGPRDLLPRRARWTTSTPTSAPRTPPTAASLLGRRRQPDHRPRHGARASSPSASCCPVAGTWRLFLQMQARTAAS